MKKSIFQSKVYLISFVCLYLTIFSIKNANGEHVIRFLQLNQSEYMLCIQSMNQDSISLYAPASLLGSMPIWYLENDSVGTGDVLHIPNVSEYIYHISIKDRVSQEIFSFNVRVNYNFSANISFSFYQNGGIWNSGRDTLWQCADSIVIGIPIPLCGKCTDYSNTQYRWMSATGAISEGSMAVINEEGLYYVHVYNSCYSIDVDTFVVIKRPNQLPQWADTTYCNEEVNKVLNCGVGWDHILWNTGEQEQVKVVNSAGNYSVELSNVCISGTSSITISQINFPLPNFNPQLSATIFCADSLVTLDPNPLFQYDSYIWNTGAITQQLFVSDNSGHYSVTVYKSGCESQATTELHFWGRPLKNDIQYVSFDNASGRNRLVWLSQQDETQGTIQRLPVDYFNIYISEPGYSWEHLTSVLAGSYNEYTDLITNANNGYVKYRIAAQDQCGAIGDYSNFISSIFLQVYPIGLNGNLKLEWNHSYSENEIYHPIKYYIYKGNCDNEFQLFDSIPGTENEYYVFNSSPDDRYQISGLFEETIFSTLEKTMIYSNKSGGCIDQIVEETNLFVNPYPNPTTRFVYLESFNGYNFTLYNSYGQLLMSGELDNYQLDLYELPNGIYFLELKQDERIEHFSLEKR